MYYKVCFGTDGHIECNQIDAIDCPNQWGGSGSITLSGISTLWASNEHIKAGRGPISVTFASVTLVESRSTGNEDDEEWACIWKRPDERWTYERDFEGAACIKAAMGKENA